MHFGILGPLEVVDDDGDPVQISSGRRRALLIALLTQANDVVCVDRLMDWLWPSGLPRSPIPTLQAHISMLRRVLEPGRSPHSAPTTLITRPPGYLLRVSPEQLDSLQLEALVKKGRFLFEHGDAENARLLLREALDLWRGEPLVDVAFLDAAQSEIGRLHEMRLTTIALRIEADLMLGRHQEIVPELTQLIVTNPLHERFHGQLMLALSRSGRRADALNVFARAREILVREMGLEPGPELRRIEAMVVDGTHDADVG